MRTWLEIHNEQVAQHAQERETAARAKADTQQTRATPMKERLRRIVRNIPPAERHWPRHLSYFTDQLKPRWSGDKAAARDVAYGLRQIGWVRKRNWQGGEAGYTTYWFPPAA